VARDRDETTREAVLSDDGVREVFQWSASQLLWPLSEMLLSPQQVVVDPGGMRHAGIDLGRQPVRIVAGGVPADHTRSAQRSSGSVAPSMVFR
jgi:hypothetical protein